MDTRTNSSKSRRSRRSGHSPLFDHVGIHVSDLAASERFYRTVLSALGVEPSHADTQLVMWDEWAIGPTDREHQVTRGLHVGVRARDRARVEAFWRAGIDAGYRNDGAPRPPTQYCPTYSGASQTDPDGNSVEAVHGNFEDAVPDGSIDHLRIRVGDLQASRRLYMTMPAAVGTRGRLWSEKPSHLLKPPTAGNLIGATNHVMRVRRESASRSAATTRRAATTPSRARAGNGCRAPRGGRGASGWCRVA